MIRIIHLSDFHLESEIPSYEKSSIISALAEDLKGFCNPETILFFSGDLIDKGGVNFKEKERAFISFEETFINPILKNNPELKGKIFLVPGNHDVVRSKIDPYSEAGLKSQLTDVKTLDAFIQSNRVKSNHLDRLSDYKEWESDFYFRNNGGASNNFDYTFKIKLGKYLVGVACLNSAWLCKDDTDKENILLGKNQIENALRDLQGCHVKLAMCHHPLEFLKEFDREAVKTALYRNFNILFTGHVHELGSSYTQDLLGDIFISIANSTIGDSPKERKYANGYTIVDLLPNEKIVTHYRKYLEIHNKFVSNTDIGTDDGTKEFRILKDEKLEAFETNQALVDGIDSRFIDKLNEHIILSANNTSVTCSIENLFVEPILLNTPQNDEKGTKYTIESILCSNENFTVYGVKESGKTLLIDKMFIEAVRKFNHYNKVPILLKFSDFKKKDIIKILREFLGISSDAINSFLEENNVVLFIDDIIFNDKTTDQIASLKELIRKYSKIQLVTTADLVIENVMPTDYLEHNDILKANVVFIQNFSSKEIKQLIQKWYVGKEVDLQENMEKLIKSFVDFGLPKTPLSVTLFLWIFEKQEKRPINNAVLVELFIENLLEKTNIENIYSETFDFTNKKRLLSFVAKFMHDNGDGDLSYSVDYVDLLTFFKNYLKTRFTGQPQKILDDFIKRGILTFEDENLIRFKSGFFFHYFLALHFDYDPTFKDYVFTDSNFLDFVEEITYYTGLKRDDVDILQFTQKKLHAAFGDFNADVRDNNGKVDKVLEWKREQTVSYQIDHENAQKKLSEVQLDEMYDSSLEAIPVQKSVPKKAKDLDEAKQIDKILKLASSVLKNSEDVDDFEAKKSAYDNTLLSSISFLIQYRDALIIHYVKHKKQPEHLPKNINFHLFIRFLPLMHQVIIFEWLGSQKLRPVIIEKIERDKTTLNISDYERFLSIFIYSDIKGSDYPEIIEDFVKVTRFNYLKDLSYLKIMSYYHLRNNTLEVDKRYLKMMARIKEELGDINKHNKSQFLKQLESKKKGKV